MDWSDLEFYLRKTYLQSRQFFSPLINRENGLNQSFISLLSKTSKESIHFQRKLVQLAIDIRDTIENEGESLIIGDIIENYGEEFILMLAKEFNVSGSKTNKDTSFEIKKFINNLSESFVIFSFPYSIYFILF